MLSLETHSVIFFFPHEYDLLIKSCLEVSLCDDGEMQAGGGGEGKNTGYWRRYFLVEIRLALSSILLSSSSLGRRYRKEQ